MRTGFDHGTAWSGPWRTDRLGGCGILLAGGANNNRIIENEVLGGHWGIQVDASVGNLVAYNYVPGNQRAGITMRAATSGNLIADNHAGGNGLANQPPTLMFDLFDESTPRRNIWMNNRGTANFL